MIRQTFKSQQLNRQIRDPTMSKHGRVEWPTLMWTSYSFVKKQEKTNTGHQEYLVLLKEKLETNFTNKIWRYLLHCLTFTMFKLIHNSLKMQSDKNKISILKIYLMRNSCQKRNGTTTKNVNSELIIKNSYNSTEIQITCLNNI